MPRFTGRRGPPQVIPDRESDSRPIRASTPSALFYKSTRGQESKKRISPHEAGSARHLQGTPIQYKILVLVQKTPNQLSAVFVIVPAFAAARFDFQFGCDGRVPPRGAGAPKNHPHGAWKFLSLLLTDARILRSRPEGVPCYLGWKSRARKWRRLGRAARAPSRSTPLSPSRPPWAVSCRSPATEMISVQALTSAASTVPAKWEMAESTGCG